MSHLRKVNDPGMRAICEELVREGWISSNGKHVKMTSPCGRRFVTVPVSPSDRRSLANFRALVRRVQRELAALGPKQ